MYIISVQRGMRVTAVMLAVLSVSGLANAKMQVLEDQMLGDESGQAAFYTNYIAPSAVINGTTQTAAQATANNGIGFFTLGLNGIVELNANINHLQLGCGGDNGASGCDIDLSQVRLAGKNPGPSGTFADSDAKLTNPFIQLAIANPLSLSTRHVVGFNLGSQQVDGQLSIGMNPTPGVAGKPGGTPGGETGINTLSGYIPTTVKNLTVPIGVCTLGPNGAGTGCNIIPPINGTATITAGSYSQVISGRRLTGAVLGPIPLTANVSFLPGIPIKANVAENLIDVHNLDASSNATSGLSLSLNSQNIAWPQIGNNGTYTWSPDDKATAQKGWWLGVAGASMDLAGITPQKAFVGIGSVFVTSNLNSMNLGQTPIQNCYGSLKFC